MITAFKDPLALFLREILTLSHIFPAITHLFPHVSSAPQCSVF